MDIWIFDPSDAGKNLLRFPGCELARSLPPSWIAGIARREAPGKESMIGGLLILVVDGDESTPGKTPSAEPVSILRHIRQFAQPIEVLVVARDPHSASVRELEDLGAQAAVSWKEARTKLPVLVEDALRLVELRHSRRSSDSRSETASRRALLYRSEVMRKVHESLVEAAGSRHEVVIIGETGAGKEQAALEINRLREQMEDRAKDPASPRSFLEFNCALLSGDVERQKVMLFGVGPGVYSGVQARQGLFERAGSGDLFLDEVECLDLGVQAMLLKALELHSIVTMGEEHRPIPFHCRLILGFKEKPRDLVEASPRRMREDLFYRLTVSNIEIPPLRERREDIPLLAYHFLLTSRDGVVGTAGRKLERIDPKTLDLMVKYEWPGNVRTLKNVIDFALIRASGRGGCLDEGHVREFIQRITPGWGGGEYSPPGHDTPAVFTPAQGFNMESEVAKLKVYWLNAVFRDTGSVEKTREALGYTNTMALLRERQILFEDHPEIAARLDKGLWVDSRPARKHKRRRDPPPDSGASS